MTYFLTDFKAAGFRKETGSGAASGPMADEPNGRPDRQQQRRGLSSNGTKTSAKDCEGVTRVAVFCRCFLC